VEREVLARGGAAANERCEPFKTTSIFDSTALNPEWLGEDPTRIQHLMPSLDINVNEHFSKYDKQSQNFRVQ
jgi:hypothetical protein